MKRNSLNVVCVTLFVFTVGFCALANFVGRTTPERIFLRLGIRDHSALHLSIPVDYPLAFRITNQGGGFVRGDTIPEMFFHGQIHMKSGTGISRQMDLTKMWRTMVYDLPPRETFESPNYANLVDYFGPLQDGNYKVWWTSGDRKSNSLQFRIIGKKIELTSD
jgi:hypothetical protein